MSGREHRNAGTARVHDWTFRFVQPGDEERAVPLLAESFAGWPKVETSASGPAHLSWKLDSHPYARRFSAVAEADGEIIATMFAFVQRALVRGNELILVQGTDQCVRSDYRGCGIMRDLRAFAWPTFEREADMRIGQTGQEAMNILRKREGSRPIGNAIEILATEGAPMAAPASPAVTERSAFDERVDAFARAACAPFDFAVVRTQAYLNWRYDERGGRSIIRTIESDGTLAGYSVLRLSHGRGYIADLLALPGRDEIVEALARDALATLGSRGADRVECWLPHIHPYRAILNEIGFARTKRIVPLTYGAWRADEDDVSFMRERDAAIHYVAGDIDLV